MNNPFKRMTKREWALWFVSIAIVVMSNIMAGRVDALTLTATCIGVTSLIFAAQGNVWAPILMTIFCSQYAIISYRFRYWGEMFTYLFINFLVGFFYCVLELNYVSYVGSLLDAD